MQSALSRSKHCCSGARNVCQGPLGSQTTVCWRIWTYFMAVLVGRDLFGQYIVVFFFFRLWSLNPCADNHYICMWYIVYHLIISQPACNANFVGAPKNCATSKDLGLPQSAEQLLEEFEATWETRETRSGCAKTPRMICRGKMFSCGGSSFQVWFQLQEGGYNTE